MKAKIKRDKMEVKGKLRSDSRAPPHGRRPRDAQAQQQQQQLKQRRFYRNRFDTIEVEAGFGDDSVRIDEVNGVFTDAEATTLSGEFGDDSLVGGSGPEVFRGGFGEDRADGKRGDDTAFMGFGDDTFVWDPGDGSDASRASSATGTRCCSTVQARQRRSTSPPTLSGFGSSATSAISRWISTTSSGSI